MVCVIYVTNLLVQMIQTRKFYVLLQINIYIHYLQHPIDRIINVEKYMRARKVQLFFRNSFGYLLCLENIVRNFYIVV